MSKKLIYLLLAVSLGLNIGVIATTLIHRNSKPAPPRRAPQGEQRRPVDAATLVEHILRA